MTDCGARHPCRQCGPAPGLGLAGRGPVGGAGRFSSPDAHARQSPWPTRANGLGGPWRRRGRRISLVRAAPATAAHCNRCAEFPGGAAEFAARPTVMPPAHRSGMDDCRQAADGGSRIIGLRPSAVNRRVRHPPARGYENFVRRGSPGTSEVSRLAVRRSVARAQARRLGRPRPGRRFWAGRRTHRRTGRPRFAHTATRFPPMTSEGG